MKLAGRVPKDTASVPPRGQLPFPESSGQRGHYQAEGAEHRQAALLGCAQLQQAHGDNDTVEDVPLFLEVVVGVEGNDLEGHLHRKKHGEDLRVGTSVHCCEVSAQGQ